MVEMAPIDDRPNRMTEVDAAPIDAMRQFVVVGHDAPTTPDFALDDLAGGAGRLDVLCRCVTSAFFLSHDIRENVRTHLVLGDAFTVTFDGNALRGLNPDERSTAALIRGALERRRGAVGHQPVEASPGISIRRHGFEATLDALDVGALVHLHEDGVPAVDRDPPADPAFVLSDHRDVGDDEAELLTDRADARLRLGPEALHADHAITVAHNYLDTDGFRSY
jgi:tRNA (pseudouridine54-N1)-methyltransferase